MRRSTLTALVALALAAGACGGGSGPRRAATTPAPSSSSSSSSASFPSTPTSTPAATGPCVTNAGTGPFAAASAATALMTDLAAQRAGCAGKVTFSFKTGTGAPGYDIAYKPGPFRDAGSGMAHAVAGNAFVVVRLHPAWIADFNQPSAPLTYTGPKSIKPAGVPHVQDLELIEAFEGYVTWAIGLDSQRPLTVATTSSPPSLVLTFG